MSYLNIKEKYPAVFLDRDGTLNVELNGIINPKQIKIINGAIESVKSLRTLGFKIIVITNQGIVARGIATESRIKKINSHLKNTFKKAGAIIDEIFYCPHHEKGIIKKYAIKCSCRKPGTALIERAVKKFNIDISKSFFIGDMTTDIKTGKNLNIKTILILTGHAGKDGRYKVKPDFLAKDLKGAARIIEKLDQHI